MSCINYSEILTRIDQNFVNNRTKLYHVSIRWCANTKKLKPKVCNYYGQLGGTQQRALKIMISEVSSLLTEAILDILIEWIAATPEGLLVTLSIVDDS